VREDTAEDRLVGVLAGAFAGLATLLAAVGLYGVLAYTVARRTREIGVRVALGASARAVRALVLGQVGRLVLAGAVFGAAGALALGRAARALLYEVGTADPLAYGGAALVLGAVALAAAALPAARAARVEPTRALRYE
jgi:ABC-type antimicrobial peptide transport system permease subunit